MLIRRKIKKILTFYLSDQYSPESLEDHFERSEIFFVQLVLFLCTLFSGKNLNKEKKEPKTAHSWTTDERIGSYSFIISKRFIYKPIVHLY